MKYKCEIVINLPRDKVIELFDNPDNLQKWQKGLISFEHISGELGKKGAKSLLVYNDRGKKTEMTETIIKRDMPEEFSALYEAKGVKNWNYNFFVKEGNDKTRWIMDNKFSFKGIMSILVIFMKRMFSKQSLKDMNGFKEFAEQS